MNERYANPALVRCEGIKKYFPIRRGYLRESHGVVKAVDGIDIEIKKGETLGLIGESGCGKTTLGKIMLGILKPDSGAVTRSTGKIQAIFQDPYYSLDPKMKVFDIVAEGLVLQGERAGKGECRPGISRKIEEVLDLVKLPQESLKRYPHQFSGGERQRIAIARAIITNPELIVCDEPVSNLDVTIQMNILNLLKTIRQKFAITFLFISHDLRVVRFMSDRIAVMYQGRIVEEGPTHQIYESPSHEYTKLLLSSALHFSLSY